MTTDELKIELARWAEFQKMRFTREQAPEDGPGSHPLSRAREFAPGTRQAAAKLLKGRDGRSRREYMGAAAGVAVVPAWACDPIPCTESRYLGPAVSSFDRGMPPGYAWVDKGLHRLAQTNPVRAVVVRVEYTVSASQGVKARIAAEEADYPLSKWQYRRELALGLAFMAGQRG